MTSPLLLKLNANIKHAISDSWWEDSLDTLNVTLSCLLWLGAHKLSYIYYWPLIWTLIFELQLAFQVTWDVFKAISLKYSTQSEELPENMLPQIQELSAQRSKQQPGHQNWPCNTSKHSLSIMHCNRQILCGRQSKASWQKRWWFLAESSFFYFTFYQFFYNLSVRVLLRWIVDPFEHLQACRDALCLDIDRCLMRSFKEITDIISVPLIPDFRKDSVFIWRKQFKILYPFVMMLWYDFAGIAEGAWVWRAAPAFTRL